MGKADSRQLATKMGLKPMSKHSFVVVESWQLWLACWALETLDPDLVTMHQSRISGLVNNHWNMLQWHAMTFIVVNHLLIDLCHFWLYLSLKRKNMDSGITGLCCVIMTHDHSTNKHQLDPNLKTHRSNLGDLEIIYIYGNLTPVLIHHLSFLCTLLICFNRNECSMIVSFGTIRNWNIHSQIQEDFLPVTTVTTPPNDQTANDCHRHFRWMPPNPP